MTSGSLLRLVLCLVVLHASGHVSAEETIPGAGNGDAAGSNGEHIEQAAGSGHTDGEAVAGGGGTAGDDRMAHVMSVHGNDDPTGRADEGADGVVDEAGGNLETVGECSGKRFKKCR